MWSRSSFVKYLALWDHKLNRADVYCCKCVIINLKQSKLGIENLNQLIFIIKNWPNDIRVGCDGPLKLKAMAEFLENDFAMIEKHNKLIEEEDFLEKDSNSDFT